MKRSLVTVAIALFLLPSCATLDRYVNGPSNERIAEIHRLRSQAEEKGVSLGHYDPVLEDLEKELNAGGAKLSEIDAKLKQAEEYLDYAVRQKEQKEATNAALKRDLEQRETPTGIGHTEPMLTQYLSWGTPPPEGTRLSLQFMVVEQKVKDGYLIGPAPYLVNAGFPGAGRFVMLKSQGKYIDGQKVDGTAAYEGQTFEYVDVTGANRTVMVLREIQNEK